MSWKQSATERLMDMDKTLKDLLYILYCMKISLSQYIDIFRKKGHRTEKANTYFIKNNNGRRSGQLGLCDEGGSSRQGDNQYENILMKIGAGSFKAVYIGGPGYPSLLQQIYLPPPVLFCSGSGRIDSFNIAVVGSRGCTKYGREAASYISENLSEIGITIVSGLALGIDSIAHREAILKKGGSIAVMGSGPDVIYPPENKRLHREIISKGAVITEFPPGMPPLRQNFPIRNRIISGISRGVIIVEAGKRSGAMITGEIALEQDREVFAVPGSIFSSASRGCHRLIKNGAKLVDSIDDVLEEFQELFKLSEIERSMVSKKEKHKKTPCLSGEAKTIYNHVGYNVISLEELGIKSGIPVKKIINILTLLEMEGIITEGPSNYYSRCD